MWVWSSWKLVWGSRPPHGTRPSRPHLGNGFDSVHPDTTLRSDWNGHTCGTTNPLFGNEHSYLLTKSEQLTAKAQKTTEWHNGRRRGGQTCVAVLVSIQSGESLVVVPWQRVPCVAAVLAQPQPVPVALWFQAEAVILGKNLSTLPVLQHDPQFVLGLFGHPVEMFQTEPVFSIQVPKAKLEFTNTFNSGISIFYLFIFSHASTT